MGVSKILSNIFSDGVPECDSEQAYCLRQLFSDSTCVVKKNESTHPLVWARFTDIPASKQLQSIIDFLTETGVQPKVTGSSISLRYDLKESAFEPATTVYSLMLPIDSTEAKTLQIRLAEVLPTIGFLVSYQIGYRLENNILNLECALEFEDLETESSFLAHYHKTLLKDYPAVSELQHISSVKVTRYYAIWRAWLSENTRPPVTVYGKDTTELRRRFENPHSGKILQVAYSDMSLPFSYSLKAGYDSYIYRIYLMVKEGEESSFYSKVLAASNKQLIQRMSK